MNVIFFQNCVSPHQMPYIKKLCEISGVDDVIVVSPVDNLEERKSMGWGNGRENNNTDANGVEILIAPEKEDVKILFEKYEGYNTWCMFSGINAFPDVNLWFRLSLDFKVRRGVITEPPYIYEHPLWQHAIRFALKDWRYTKYIDKVFVMGDEYLWYYRMWSNKWDVIPFMYCTEWRERILPVLDEKKLKVLYVGSLSHRKNVAELLQAVKRLRENQKCVEVGIVGDGDERTNLNGIVNASDYNAETIFYGSMNMDSIPEVMQKYDVLVLPSLHDGWGAVINEALILGLYVICSDNCGAKYLLKNTNNGMVYHSGKVQELSSLLDDCLTNKDEIRNLMTGRIEWANKHVSGKSIAKYFIDCLREQ